MGCYGSGFILRKTLGRCRCVLEQYVPSQFILFEARFDKIRDPLRNTVASIYRTDIERFLSHRNVIDIVVLKLNYFSITFYTIVDEYEQSTVLCVPCVTWHIDANAHTYADERLRNQTWPRNSCWRQKRIKKKRTPSRNRSLQQKSNTSLDRCYSTFFRFD